MAFRGNVALLVCATTLALIFGPGGQGETGHASLRFLMRGWATPTLWNGFLMCACGFIAAVGLTALTRAYRISRSSVVARFA